MGDLEFTPDGKKMFIIDDNHNGIKQYRCESAFELDTCEYVDGLNLKNAKSTGLEFNKSGTKMYFLDTKSDKIKTSMCDIFSVFHCTIQSKKTTLPSNSDIFYGLEFSPDGKKLFFFDTENSLLHQYDCKTAFKADKNCKPEQTLEIPDTYPTSLAISPDGKKMIIAGSGSDVLLEYNCDEGIKSCILDNTLDISEFETRIRGVEYNNDGTKLFISGYDSKSVHSFSLDISYTISSIVPMPKPEIIVEPIIEPVDDPVITMPDVPMPKPEIIVEPIIEPVDDPVITMPDVPMPKPEIIVEPIIEPVDDPVITMPDVTMPQIIEISTEEEPTHNSCSDCTPPTLGYDQNGRQLVTDGFSYNGYSTDVAYFFTPYPLLTVNIGEPNIVELKIYENSGAHNIRHIDLAFGLEYDETLSQSNVRIEYDVDLQGNGTINIVDPDNTIEDDSVSVATETVSCTDDFISDCLLVTIYHTFRAPLSADIVATNVWDHKRNAWQNYYNHGIHIEGESLNELPGMLVNNGTLRLYHTTERSMHSKTMLDDSNILYILSHDGFYYPKTNNSSLYDKVDESRYIPSKDSLLSFNRNIPEFKQYKMLEQQRMSEMFDSLYDR